jgi:exonuclease III
MLQRVMQPHIIVITESWLTDNVLNEQIALPGFGSPFRQDRQDGRRGGGVCVYVKENVSCIPVPNSATVSNSPEKCERVLLKFTETNIILLALYVPPNLSKCDQEAIIMSISDTFERILAESDSAKLLVAGDLNDLPTADLELQFSLKQIVKNPTRGNAILDKILLDDKLVDLYNTPTVGPNLST